jgi:tetratricopeptide (TPR) repeat protein
MDDDGASGSGLLGLIKRATGWAGFIITFVTGVVGFVRLVRDEAGLVTLIALYTSTLILWGGCFYVYFLKKQKPVQGGFTGNVVPKKEYAFSKRFRRYAGRGIFIVPVLFLAGAGTWAYIKSRRPDQIIVVLAQFENLDNQVTGVTENIRAQLDMAVRGHNEIKIEYLGRAIPSSEGVAVAQSVLDEKKASVVLYGFHNKDQIRAFIKVDLTRPSYLPLAETDRSLNINLSGRQLFEVKMGLSKAVTYITLLSIAIVQCELQKYEDADKLLREALRLAESAGNETPQSVTSDDQFNLAICHFYRGRIFYDTDKYEAAIAEYEKALALKPDFAIAYLYLGLTYQIRGNKENAVRALDKAKELYTALLSRNPEDVDAYIYRGITYNNRGEHALAIKDYDAALTLKPNDARVYENRGVSYYETGDFEHAFLDLNEAIKIDPKAAGALNNRGNAYFKKGDLDHALQDYNSVIKLRPASALDYLNRALLFMERREYDKAIADLDRAIQLDPKNVRFYRNRGYAHLFNGEGELAARDAQTFLSMKQDCDGIFLYMTFVGFLGYRKANKMSEAEALINKAAADCHDTAWPYNVVRYYRQEISAEELLSQAVNSDPKITNNQLTEAHAYIGMNLSISGQRKEALSHLVWVRDNGNPNYDEHSLAISEISRIEATGR